MPDPVREFPSYSTHFPPIMSDMIGVTEAEKAALPKIPQRGQKLHVIDVAGTPDDEGWDYSNGVDNWRYPANAGGWADH